MRMFCLLLLQFLYTVALPFFCPSPLPLTNKAQAAFCSGTVRHRKSWRTAQATCQACAHVLLYAAIRSPGLPIFKGLHPCNPCNYMDYCSFTDPRGLEGIVGVVGLPIVDTSLMKWSHVNRRSGAGLGKSAGQRPTS